MLVSHQFRSKSRRRIDLFKQAETTKKDCDDNISAKNDTKSTTMPNQSSSVHFKQKPSYNVGQTKVSYCVTGELKLKQNEKSDFKKESYEKRNVCNNHSDEDEKCIPFSGKCTGGKYCKYRRSIAFPMTVHEMVSKTSITNPEIMDWIADGEAFIIHNTGKELSAILKRYFHHGRYSSLQRQLNMYGWKKYISGKYRGGFQHPRFHRDNKSESEFALIKRNGQPKHPAKTSEKRKLLPSSDKEKVPKKKKSPKKKLYIKKERNLAPIQKKKVSVDSSISDHHLFCKEEMPSSRDSPRCVSNGGHMETNDIIEFYDSSIQYSLNVSPLLCKEKVSCVKRPIPKIKSNMNKFSSRVNIGNEQTMKKFTIKEFLVHNRMKSRHEISLPNLDFSSQHLCPNFTLVSRRKLPLPPNEEWSPFHDLGIRRENASVDSGSTNRNLSSNEDKFIHTSCADEDEKETTAAALVLSALCRSK